jgi:cephalosporin hydroxylase
VRNLRERFAGKPLYLTILPRLRLEPKLDWSRLALIQSSSLAALENATYLEHVLIPALGFNLEQIHEQPEIVLAHGGGLRLWQYPNQFSKYLTTLRALSPRSYIEVGCRWGGTFAVTVEYLSRFGGLEQAVAVDLEATSVVQYVETCGRNVTFVRADSTGREFADWLAGKRFDVAFIDGDHSYQGVSRDFVTLAPLASILVFHDICSHAVPGVAVFWMELKAMHGDTYDFYEFLEQYPDVLARMRVPYLGIGIAVKKTWRHEHVVPPAS